MSELYPKKSWVRKYGKWMLLPMVVIIVLIAIISIRLGDPIADFSKAMLDPTLSKNALKIVQKDEAVLSWMGDIAPINVLSILEGEPRYSDDNQSVDLTVGITGSKKRGKMDIKAIRKGDQWEYKEIKIRTKKPKKTIQVLLDK